MKRLPRPAIVAVKLLIAAALIGLLVATTDLQALGTGLSHLSYPALAAGTALLILWTSFNSMRWGLVLRGLGHPLSAGVTWTLGMVGLFFSQFLPSSVGGDAVRVALVNRRGVPLGVAFSSALIDRAVTLLFYAVVLVIATPAIAGRLVDWRLTALIAGASLAICLAGLLPLLPVDWGSMMPSWLQPLAATIEHYRFTLLRSPHRPALIGLSALAYAIPSAVFYIFARDMGLPVSLLDCLLLVPPVILAMALPVSFAGWGVRELSVVALFGAVGVASADGLVMSIAYGATNVVAGLIGGAVWQLSGMRRSKGEAGSVPSA
jgi:uncharacterized membrane protein YbhN (UPF0104 family)